MVGAAPSLYRVAGSPGIPGQAQGTGAEEVGALGAGAGLVPTAQCFPSWSLPARASWVCHPTGVSFELRGIIPLEYAKDKSKKLNRGRAQPRMAFGVWRD